MLVLAGIIVVVRIEKVKRVLFFRERNGQIVVLKLDVVSDR